MKRLTLIVMAGLLMLGLTQCKKEQSNTNTNAEGEWVNITVKVDGGDRHIVYPNTGAVLYSDGDVIYVGNDHKYVGQLTYANGTFSGRIYNPSTTDYLHFYFLGGTTPSETPVTAETNPEYPTRNFTVNIRDQREKLPVLSYGRSTQKYINGNTTYGCTLENQCALVEFSLEYEAGTVSIGNMVASAFVDFNTPGINPSGIPEAITLYSKSPTSKWAILLPKSTQTSTTISGTSYAVTIPAIAANGYVHGDNAVYIDNTPPDASEYVFSVAADRTVQFSPGNLQATYNGANCEWAFAEHQWDCIGNAPGNTTIVDHGISWYDENFATVDLFGWSTDATIFGIYGSDDADVYSGAFVDWGINYIYNPLTDDYDPSNTWRTLEQEEWEYLFEERDPGLCGAATVNGVHGLIILPDNFDGSFSLNSTMSGWGNNVVSASDWEDDWESHGAVFLPAAGFRLGTDVDFDYVGSLGLYWSATPIDESSASGLYFEEGSVDPSYEDSRSLGYGVRLVR